MALAKKSAWQEATIGDVAEIVRDSIVADQISDGTRYVGLEHIDGDGNILNPPLVANGDLASNKFQFGPNHILYGKLRPYLRKTSRPDFSGVCSTDILPILSGPRLDRGYLFHYLRHPKVVELATSRCEGVNLPRLSPRQFELLTIPLPPLAEQKRIAAILDKADALRRKRKLAGETFNELTMAYFFKCFNQKALDRTKPLSEIGVDFRYGTSNKSGIRGYPALRIPNIIGGTIDFEDLKTVEVEEAELDRLRLLEGDMLFVRTNGNPDYVGRSAVFKHSLVQDSGFDVNDFIYASYLIRARVEASSLEPVFLQHYLQTPSGRHALRERCKTSAGQYNINTEGLGAIPVPAIGLAQQQAFARLIDRIDVMRQPQFDAAHAADNLFNSLVQRAFRGEL